MESAAISGASWVVGKALSPLSDGLVEAWAASSELSPNIEAVKTELLYALAMLDNARGREIRSHALAELLQKLRALAYDAEDVLDELDYFRIQDELEGTFETVDRGCIHNLLRDARNTAKAAAKQLQCTYCFSAARGVGDPYERGARRRGLLCDAWPCGGADEESCKCVRRLTTSARSTAHAVGKRLLCSSLLPVDDDDDGDQHSSTSRNRKQIICGVCNCTGMASQKKHAPKTPKLDFDRVDVSRRMKHIVEQLQPICAKVSTILDLELLGSAVVKLELLGSSRSIGSDTSTSRPITTSGIIEPTLYGRENERKTILENITKGEYFHEGLTVIPIVGPGGIGKTTLTQHICNSSEVQEHFQIKVWICVSLDFNVYRLTKEIEKSIPKAADETNSTDGDPQNLDQLQKLIKKRLKNKRFLVVLDDIWKFGNEDEWKRLLVPFTGQEKGNIVLVTTRFLEVADMVRTRRTDKVIQLDGLEPAEFWDFFKACVFGHCETKQHSEDRNLLDIGEKIVEKLKCSPLAAKTVGSLLRNNLTVDHWTRVLESKEWESQSGDHDIMPALKLSYDYLPFHLQQCFSYSALFPEDYKFKSEELICFWIGLDILRPGHATKRIEDVGLNYLNELVNYGFFKTDEQATYYVIHDLLHDLALKVSSQECLHIASSSSRPIEIPPSICHLSISMSPANSEDGTIEENFRKELGKVQNRLKSENLHTVMLFGEYDANFVGTFCDLFKDAKSLRVVHLSTMSHPVESILHNFSKLVHLRYLRLVTKYGSKVHLPRSLSRFYQLMVLDIERWHGAFSLPRDMTNLVKLRHFLVPYDEEQLHSSIPNVGKLRCLQELRGFRVKKESNGFELRELGQLSELGGSLVIYNLGNVQVNETHEAKLLYKNRLQELTLNWGKDRSNEGRDKEDQVLEGLRPHDSLRELCIDGHGGFTCPTWLGTKLSVKVLEALRLDGVAWETLPPLGELWLIDEHGEKLCGCITGPSFQKLKRLVLVGLPKFRKWVAKEACPMFFSLLEELVVQDCVELTELPFSFYTCHPLEGDGNATWFPKLQVLHIDKCPKLLSLPHIPYSHTLCDVEISHPQTGLEILEYSNKTSSLRIEGNEALHRLDDKVLAFHNLAQLQELKIRKCPPLAAEHLQMLTSLETLKIEDSSNVFMPLERRSDVQWQLPVSPGSGHKAAGGTDGGDGEEGWLRALRSLQSLEIWHCGGDLRGEGLWPLLTRGQLTHLTVYFTPKFFAVDLRDEDQGQQLLLRELHTDDIAGVLAAPICKLLSSCLTKLLFRLYRGVERFTKEQEEALHLLTSLQELRFYYCDKLQCLPAGLHRLTNLKILDIWRCTALRSLPKEGLPTSLQQLHIYGCPALRSLPKQGLPSSLQQLTISHCPAIRSLPKQGFPSSLQQLTISYCPALRSLPKQGLPSSLQQLDVRYCGNVELKQRCRKLTGTIPKIIL